MVEGLRAARDRASGCAVAEPVTLAEEVDFLAHRAWPPGAELIETHLSCVFLTHDRVYKLKKPVAVAFVDYRTLAARRRDCAAEVALNRALAPGVYLGTLPLRRAGGELTLGDEGEIVDWLVVMRRLPTSDMLDDRIRRGAVCADRLDDLAERLTAFYAATRRAPRQPEAYRRELIGWAAEARDRLLAHGGRVPVGLVGAVFDRQAALAGSLPELDQRAGAVVDAHGDLRPEHVVIDGAPLVIDRLTFDERLRELDPLVDLALLAVECERLGAGWVGERVARAWGRRSGDVLPDRAWALYRSLRASTRARLSIDHLDDAGADEVRWVAAATGYLRLAATHLSVPAPDGPATSAAGAERAPHRAS